MEEQPEQQPEVCRSGIARRGWWWAMPTLQSKQIYHRGTEYTEKNKFWLQAFLRVFCASVVDNVYKTFRAGNSPFSLADEPRLD